MLAPRPRLKRTMTTDQHLSEPMRSAAAQKAALAEAEARCKARGAAWTPPRRRTYELLLAAAAPRTAYELMESYKTGRRHAAPPTVYRALDFLVAIGLAHRVESRRAYLACAAPGDPHAAAFLICDGCGRTDELLHHLDDWGPAPAGFVVRSISLEIRGTCPVCR